jgi:homoserine O-acetyltransferase/O-succinyltransferase
MAARTLLVLGLVVLTGGCVTSTPPSGTTPAAALRPAALLGPPEFVVSRMFTSEDFRLESGQVLPHLTLAYETYGRLAADGRNAILVTHGFTSSHHAAGRYAATDPTPGWWDGLIGPGKTIDTDRYFVVSSNMLGSSYGSTAPASIDPRTGRRYGPEFPDITVRDIVAAQRLLLAGLGVKRLVAVAGPSYGGFQAFQWAVTYPDFMQGIVAVVTAPKSASGPAAVDALVKRFAADPNWNSGWHYDRGGIPATMTALRLETLKRYGQNEILAVSIADPQQRAARMREMAVKWAGEFDPNSMVALRKASVRFDAESDFSKMQAKVLYVLSRTDQLFPPSIAPVVMDRLARAGVEAQYVEINTEFGHQASGTDWAKWAAALKAFLEKLER